MLRYLAVFARWIRSFFASRSDLLLENLALRQPIAVLATRRPRRRLPAADRLFWIVLHRVWPRWQDALILIQPDTVVRWYRQGFRQFWKWKSRVDRVGRPPARVEIRTRVRRIAAENPTWGAPRIHGESLMLGDEVSERTVSRLMPRRPADRDAGQRWCSFLRNHREVLAAMDFFTVPTATFRVLYVFFVIHHARRRVLHVCVTAHPTAAWVTQQLREAYPLDELPRYLICDRDPKYIGEVMAKLERMGIGCKQTAAHSPWHNGVAERWVETVRRELLDHVIVLNARQLYRLMSEYVAYYHDDRTHLGLGQETPARRGVAAKPNGASEVVALPRVGGLHHRYEWRTAA